LWLPFVFLDSRSLVENDLMKIISLTKIFTSPALLLAVVLCALTAVESSLFTMLSLDPHRVASGEIWRLLTGNLVHFGWAHTLMNTAALLLVSMAFFFDYPDKKFCGLLAWCCLCVGLEIYWLNPEYAPYAGLSGAIHGLIVAGLMQTRAYPMWMRTSALALIVAKLIHENSPGYQATDLQALIPAAVAVESHLYGTIAGAIFGGGDWLLSRIKRKA
jgi:rhomboid family GlyGly-CTERM serine protease